MRVQGTTRRGLIAGAAVVIVAAVVGVVLLVTGSKSAIDNTAVGGTLTGDRLKQVFGHLFDGANTVHLTFTSSDAPSGPSREADVILGPPVQAKITLTTATTPPQTGTIIIKDGKAYLQAPSLGSKWILVSSANDGMSGTPGVGQTSFALAFLGPRSMATYKGTATINGIGTREYVIGAAPDSTNASPGTSSQVVATVWIDDSGRLVRFSYSPGSDATVVTVTYSQWGEPVSIQAPPTQDVTVLQGTM